MNENHYQVLLTFIAKFGVVHERHLAIILPELFKNKSILKKMVKDTYVNEHKIQLAIGSYYTLGSLGAKFMESKEVKALNFNTLNHDMLLLDLYFDLLAKNPDLEILSERELKVGMGIKVGDKKKVPDLLMVNINGQQTAIELEITEKSHARLIEIINNYIVDTTLHQIHYFVKSNTLGKKLLELAGYHQKLRVFLLDKNDTVLAYSEIARLEDTIVAKSAWSFDLDYYLSNPDKYKK